MNKNIKASKADIINTVKILIHKKNSLLFDKIDFEDNNIYLEPLLFSYFNSKNDNTFPIEALEEILQGYYTKKRELILSHSYNNNGIAYVPKLGYFNKQAKTPFLPIEIINGTNIEIIKYSHPLLDAVFKMGSDNIINESNINFGDDIYNKNIEFLEKAFGFIKITSKKHYDLIEQYCKKIVLFKTNPINTNSFATINAHGIAFFNVYQEDYDEVFFVDDIAHQTGHIILTTILFERKKYFLIDETINIGSITKNIKEYRSFYVFFHALYTYYTTLLCLVNCLENNCLDKRQSHEAKGRIGFYIRKCMSDLNDFEKVRNYYKCIENVLTKEGIDLFDEIKNKLIEIITKWRSVTVSLDYKNQPYNFTYQEFIKLNPITE